MGLCAARQEQKEVVKVAKAQVPTFQIVKKDEEIEQQTAAAPPHQTQSHSQPQLQPQSQPQSRPQPQPKPSLISIPPSAVQPISALARPSAINGTLNTGTIPPSMMYPNLSSLSLERDLQAYPIIPFQRGQYEPSMLPPQESQIAEQDVQEEENEEMKVEPKEEEKIEQKDEEKVEQKEEEKEEEKVEPKEEEKEEEKIEQKEEKVEPKEEEKEEEKIEQKEEEKEEEKKEEINQVQRQTPSQSVYAYSSKSSNVGMFVDMSEFSRWKPPHEPESRIVQPVSRIKISLGMLESAI